MATDLAPARFARQPRQDEAQLWDYASGAGREFATSIGRRRTAAGAPVRNLFVASTNGDVPPLASLLRGGGRGGALRLKVYLSLLWVCARPPYHTTRAARDWAVLLGLPMVDTNGVRRIHEAIKDLTDRRLITVQARGGQTSVLTLLNESGSGEPYEPPSEAHHRLKADSDTDPAHLQHHRYFKIPSWVWTHAYMAKLSGPGLAMLLVLLHEQRGQTGREVWFSPKVADTTYHLANATRTSGLHQLRELGLIQTRKAAVDRHGALIDFHRRRNVHLLIHPATTNGQVIYHPAR